MAGSSVDAAVAAGFWRGDCAPPGTSSLFHPLMVRFLHPQRQDPAGRWLDPVERRRAGGLVFFTSLCMAPPLIALRSLPLDIAPPWPATAP